MPEPGKLPLGIAPRGLLQRRYTLGQRRRIFKIRKKLFIANCLCHTGPACPVRIHLFRLFQKSLRHHGVHPCLNAGIQLRTVCKSQCQNQRFIRCLLRFGSSGALRCRLARGLVQFQSAQQARVVVRVNGGGALRVQPAKAPIQGPGALLGKFLLQAAAHIGVSRLAGKRNALQKAAQIQPCAAAQDRQPAARGNFLHSLPGHGGIIGGGTGSARLQHANQMVRHALHLFPGRRRGANMQPFINLHGIGRNHFPVQALCKLYRQGGFPAGGGAAHAQKLNLACQTVFPAPSAALPAPPACHAGRTAVSSRPEHPAQAAPAAAPAFYRPPSWRRGKR